MDEDNWQNEIAPGAVYGILDMASEIYSFTSTLGSVISDPARFANPLTSCSNSMDTTFSSNRPFGHIKSKQKLDKNLQFGSIISSGENAGSWRINKSWSCT